MSARVRVRRGGDVKGLARIGSAVVPRFWRFGPRDALVSTDPEEATQKLQKSGA